MGFGPGGLGDIAGRAIGQVITQSTGQAVVVENMPGAGGSNAALALTRGAPDGHTLLWVSSQNAIAPSMFKSLPYDWSRDFTAVGPMATFDFVLFVHKDSPLKTVRDVIEAAKANPEKFNFGSISVGTAQNLSTLNFVAMAGLKVPTVPFRTTGEVITASCIGKYSGGVRDHSGRHRPDQWRHACGRSPFRRPSACRSCRTFRPSRRAASRATGPIRGTASWRRPRPRSNVVAKVNKDHQQRDRDAGNPETVP